MRQAAGAGGGVADGFAVALDQPDRVIGMLQDDALPFDRVMLVQERLQVRVRVQMAESFHERARADARHGRGIVRRRAAYEQAQR